MMNIFYDYKTKILYDYGIKEEEIPIKMLNEQETKNCED